jgi:hypothetical protein
MGNHPRLGFGEFMKDIGQVIGAPGRRFTVIKERGASWGSLLLLLTPAYFALGFTGGLVFAREPFPGYVLFPPLLMACIAVFFKLGFIHACARLLQGRNAEKPGKFSDLTVVFGYTGVPAILAVLLATAVWLSMPAEIGYLMHDLKAVGISIIVAVAIALFVWNLILVVLALRTVYSMRDIKLVAAFVLGSTLIGIFGMTSMWVVAQPHIDLKFLEPMLSNRMLRSLSAVSASGEGPQIEIHADRIAYRLRNPERFEWVAFLLKDSVEKRDGTTVTAEESYGRWWRSGNCGLGRIIGMPGDTVQMTDGTVEINGQVLQDHYLGEEYRAHANFPMTKVESGKYLVFPENRRLIDTMKSDLIVDRDRILGRQILTRWPIGWWIYQPFVFSVPVLAAAH